MKKIGILTYHRAHNYGAFMQSYALSQRLNKLYPEHKFEIIDFSYRNDLNKRLISSIKHLLRFGFSAYKKLRESEKAFEASYSHLPLSSKRHISNNTDAIIRTIEQEYDAVIVGSDAVFNWNSNPIPNIYFFNSERCPHLSYAASVHLNRYQTATEAEARYLKEALGRFNYLGVRDEESERFVRHFNPNCLPHHNCDPTVLLDFDFETPELEAKLCAKGISLDDKMICVMLKKPIYAKYLKEWLGNEYKIIAVRRDNPYADAFLGDLTPFEWAKVFRYAKLTVTDFFHGSLLSLKNGTPVISIDSSGYEGEYESKAFDFFTKRVDLPEFFYRHSFEEEDLASFKKQAFNALQTDYSEIIPNALQRESESFTSFQEALTQLLGR
jgi:polysaccharide pyruvyl transferase WcaK-like protein